MPKGIKKITAATLRAEIEKLQASLQDKKNRITRCKQECSEKVQKLNQEIAACTSQIKKLERAYKNAVTEEQRQTIASIVFHENLSDAEITDVIGAVQTLLSDSGNHRNAVSLLQKIADAHDSSTMNALAEELGQTEK